MAEFLVESLLADALLLERWGARGVAQQPQVSANDSADAGIGSTKRLSAMELRRKRNREFMQRVRRKHREEIEAMRETVEELTVRFEQLRTQQQRPMIAQRQARLSALEAAYGTLAETSHRLKAENFHIERLLVEHDKARLRVLQALHVFSWGSSSAATQLEEEPATQFYKYVAISATQAQDAISKCYRRTLQYEESARPLAHWLVEDSGPSQTFGWTINCEISSGNNFFLCMTKRLPETTAEDAAQRAWSFMSRPRRQDKGPARRIARSDLLQTLSDSTCVVANDWHHPLKSGVRMRTVGVRFRLQKAKDQGFVVGMSTLVPEDAHRTPEVEHRDLSQWYDFTPDESGRGCLLRMRTLTQYNTLENLQMRLMNVLCATWRWESDVMKTRVNLLASCT